MPANKQKPTRAKTKAAPETSKEQATEEKGQKVKPQKHVVVTLERVEYDKKTGRKKSKPVKRYIAPKGLKAFLKHAEKSLGYKVEVLSKPE